MTEPVKISTDLPVLSSMRFDELRATAISYIQNYSGKIWTDHNTHDPGIAIIEALAFAITDLGYRINFDIADILANNPAFDIDYKNFFSARQILHSRPVNFNDYRKLLMDVSVFYSHDGEKEELGIKNAWLTKSNVAERKIYSDSIKGLLSLNKTSTDETGYFVCGLYNVLLEFDFSNRFGDLNSSSIEAEYQVNEFPADVQLEGLQFIIEITFPRWDNLDVDFNNKLQVMNAIEAIVVNVEELPSGYELSGALTVGGKIGLTGTRPAPGGREPIPDLTELENVLNAFLFDSVEGALGLYLKKVEICKKISDRALLTLQNKRNLCEDWFSINALKIEEIAVCADVEISNDAKVNFVMAEIEFRISQFLSPTVNFYSLPDMQAKKTTDGTPYKTEDIFNGPALEHGFIDDTELILAERKKCIHVSDLIHLIMDVPGVKAVRSIQIANIPEDNEAGIISHSVKWCLELAFDELYVPRYSQQKSKFIFFKEDLPFIADETEVAALIKPFYKSLRPRFVSNPILDIEIPKGKWRELDSYVSVQEEFPNNYGIGIYGLPANADNKRVAQANQLKAFLTLFDQLMADLLSQLTGIKELFSMNSGQNKYGDLIFDKTYFSQSLTEVIPNGKILYIDSAAHATKLQTLVESQAEYEKRKNQFLDHLLARYAEQFTDYGLLLFSMEGELTPSELIKDKLAFLNQYPDISANRGGALDYWSSNLWHRDFVGGYEKRMRAVLGIDEPDTSGLIFSTNVLTTGGPVNFGFELQNAGNSLLTSYQTFGNELDLKLGIENAISAACNPKSFSIEPNPALSNKFLFKLWNNSRQKTCLGISKKLNYNTTAAALTDVKLLVAAMQAEMQTNIQSSRNNLCIDFGIWFKTKTLADIIHNPPLYGIEYEMYNTPKTFLPQNKILTGKIWAAGDTLNVTALKDRAAAEQNILLWQVLRYAVGNGNYTFDPANKPYGLNYKFIITDIRGDEIGKSENSDFNKHFADLIQSSSGGIEIRDSALNDGVYSIVSATSDGPYIRIQTGSIIPAPTPDGIAVWTQKFPCVLSATARQMVVAGENLTDRLRPGDKISITSGVHSNGNYQIKHIFFEAGDTIIISAEPIPADDAGFINFEFRFRIQKTTANELVIYGNQEEAAVQDFIDFINKTFFEKEGLHVIEHLLLRPGKTGDYQLLDIQTDNDCEDCNLTDPYSFVMSVVLPYWPEKFRDIRFRQFVEKAIRSEAPAHLALNICWINPIQMAEFENKYRAWLFSKNASPFNENNLRIAQNDLLNILQQLRSIYPEGLLHNCETDSDKMENAIVLNKTALGRP